MTARWNGRSGRGRFSPERGDTLRLARLELNVANIYHRQDRFAEALAAYEHAYRQLLPLSATRKPSGSRSTTWRCA